MIQINVMLNRDYLLLIYTCMCIILFLMIIILSFQSRQIRMLSAGLGMAWNRCGLSCNKENIFPYIFLSESTILHHFETIHIQ